ncbi:histidine kinase [Spirosoma sp. BT702]|uniref:Histidine kinase n=1 Tax=Spirosoma profusum TaxID=2771354 RepID=A0A926Y145_9BACT|nr:histidine kinase [Spirosoma profusum]MBD2704664.1 histidine kinase [Spirosoma profusum]
MKSITIHTKIALQFLLILILFIHISIITYVVFSLLQKEQVNVLVAWLLASITGLFIIHNFFFFIVSFHPLIQREQIEKIFRNAFGPVIVWSLAGILLHFIIHEGILNLSIQAPNQKFLKLPIIDQYIIDPIQTVCSRSFEWLHFIINPLTISFILIGCSLYIINIAYIGCQFGTKSNYWARWYVTHCKRINRWLSHNPDYIFHIVFWIYLTIWIFNENHFSKTLIEKFFYFGLSLIILYGVMLLRLNREYVYKTMRKQFKVRKEIKINKGYRRDEENFFLILTSIVVCVTYLESIVGPELNTQFTEAVINKEILPMNIFLALCGFLAATAERSNQLNREKLREIVRKEQLSKQINEMLMDQIQLLTSKEQLNTKINELMKFQLQLLNSQINSHFFFASLKFLYAESKSLSKGFSESILLLSDILRYTLDAAKPNKLDESSHVIHLESELEHIENFIKFSKQTSYKPLFINFTKQGDYDFIMIIPLLLVTFVENAFKYGEINDPQNPVEIHLVVESYKVTFSVQNKKTLLDKGQKSSTGIGLQNVRSRLNIEYPGAHKLTILDGSMHYAVILVIDL